MYIYIQTYGDVALSKSVRVVDYSDQLLRIGFIVNLILIYSLDITEPMYTHRYMRKIIVYQNKQNTVNFIEIHVKKQNDLNLELKPKSKLRLTVEIVPKFKLTKFEL